MSGERERVWVRLRENWSSRSIDPPGVRHFHAGEVVMMLLVDGNYWDSFDIDGAHIIPGDKADVIAEPGSSSSGQEGGGR